jgi:plasmid stabilization system protein ParE
VTRALLVRPPAEADIERAFRWYEEQSPGLGAEFVRAIDAALAAVQRQPELYPDVHHGIRRILLRRFPYGLFFLVQPDRVQVLACMHERQSPRRWQSRR